MIKVSGPGKFVEPRFQGGLVRCTWGAAVLGAEPASVKAGASGANEGTQPSRESLQWRPVAGLECYAAPPAVGSGENEVCQSRSGSVSGEVDMEVEDIRGEFEVVNAVKNLCRGETFSEFQSA